MQFAKNFDLIAAPDAKAGCRPLADAIDREKRRFLKRRREKGGCGMRLVMFREKDPAIVVQLFTNEFFHPDFFFDPERNGLEKGLNACGRAREISMQNPVELDKRLFVKGDIINSIDRSTCFPQAIVGRVFGKRGVVLLAGEAFFL